MVWDDLITSSYVDMEMKSMGVNFSKLEQIDLIQGTTTGFDNIHYMFNNWWSDLGLCKRTDPMCEDTLTPLQLEGKIKDWRELREYEISDGNFNERRRATGQLILSENFKNFYIQDESKIQKYFSIYQQGYFMPDEIAQSFNLKNNRSANGKYIFIPFKDISSKLDFKPSQEDIESYYTDNKFNFANKEKTRKLDYYIFTNERDDIESKDSIYDVAREFNDSAKSVKEYKNQARNYNIRPGSITLNSIMETQILPNIITDSDQARNIVRWAYGVNKDDREIEQINPGETYHFKMGKTQIIFCLNTINENDYKSVEDVKTEIIKELTNQMRGEEINKVITKLINSSMEIDELANVLGMDFNNLELNQIENLKYSDNKFSERNIIDNELIGTFFGMPLNIISEPYIGQEGVYIIIKESIQENTNKSFDQTKRSLISNSIFFNPINFRSQIITQAKEEDGSVIDERFYLY